MRRSTKEAISIARDVALENGDEAIADELLKFFGLGKDYVIDVLPGNHYVQMDKISFGRGISRINNLHEHSHISVSWNIEGEVDLTIWFTEGDDPDEDQMVIPINGLIPLNFELPVAIAIKSLSLYYPPGDTIEHAVSEFLAKYGSVHFEMGWDESGEIPTVIVTFKVDVIKYQGSGAAEADEGVFDIQ